MNSFSAIIDAFGQQEFAAALDIEESHARTMKFRNSIPSNRWLATVRAAKERGIKGVTLDLMARLDAEKSKQRESAQ